MRKRHRLLMIAISTLSALVIFGTFFFSKIENWNLVDAFYFSSMTVTTIGYGDLVPTHSLSKIITSLYAVVSIPISLFVFGLIAEEYFEVRLTRMEKKVKEIISREKDIEKEIEKDYK